MTLICYLTAGAVNLFWLILGDRLSLPVQMAIPILTVLLAGTGTLMITAMREIKVKMNVSANTTLLNTTRMISDSLLNNFSSDQQQLETCANLFSRIDLEQPEDVVRALAEYTEATSFFRFDKRRPPGVLICYKICHFLNQICLFNTNISIYSATLMLYFILV